MTVSLFVPTQISYFSLESKNWDYKPITLEKSLPHISKKTEIKLCQAAEQHTLYLQRR